LEGLRHEAPFETGRETCASATAQRRFLHFRDDPLGRELLLDDLLQRLVAAARLVVLEAPVPAVEAGHDDRVGAVVEFHFLSSSRSASSLSFDMKPHMRLLSTINTGASPQAPMHSPSLSVMPPSVVVSLNSMPSRRLRCSAASTAPESAHGRLVQMTTLCLPGGFRLYIA